jgi:hypothetical protein
MDASSNRVFISYRRDDASGYAGRLEEALERRLGRGSVFRDVLDIPPGEDFVKAIRTRLADAQTVLVLIGPRWAGGDVQGQPAGQRRIDDPHDFVRLEVAVALDSGVRVVPVLLPGASMPAEDSLPAPLKALARRNAMSLGDTHWDADIGRLADSIGVPAARTVWPWALGSAALAAAVVAAWCWLRPAPVAAPVAKPDASQRIVGVWQAEVRYDWGDRYQERFEFKRHAGELTGTASFLGYPRAIEKLQVDGLNIHFDTHSIETMGDSSKEVTRAYAAEFAGAASAPVLRFRMQSSGGHSGSKPIEFEARPVVPAAGEAPAQGRRL